MNTDHLAALYIGLDHERERLANATSQKEIAIRTVFVAQIKKEIAGEMKFLGMADLPKTNTDELLAELLN